MGKRSRLGVYTEIPGRDIIEVLFRKTVNVILITSSMATSVEEDIIFMLEVVFQSTLQYVKTLFKFYGCCEKFALNPGLN